MFSKRLNDKEREVLIIYTEKNPIYTIHVQLLRENYFVSRSTSFENRTFSRQKL